MLKNLRLLFETGVWCQHLAVWIHLQAISSAAVIEVEIILCCLDVWERLTSVFKQRNSLETVDRIGDGQGYSFGRFWRNGGFWRAARI